MLVYLGTFIEFFEFMLFVTLFPVLSKFFNGFFSPQQTAALTYFLFFIGFIARPLGSFFLSPIGDKKGRKTLLVISVVGMSISTILMGCIPIYTEPKVVILCIALLRFFQGFFTGTEYAIATIYTFEKHQKENKKSGYQSILKMGLMITLGMSCAYFVAAICQLEFLNFLNFWRAAFLLTGFTSLWIGLLRLSRLPEIDTPITEEKPFTTIKTSPLKYLYVFFLIGVSFAPFYFITTFLNIYQVILGKSDPIQQLVISGCICLFYSIAIYLIYAKLPLLFYKKNYITFYHVLFIILLWPFTYFIFELKNLWISISLQAILIFISQLIVSHINVNLPELFNFEKRVRSYATLQALSASIIGGTTPLLCQQLASYFGRVDFAAIYPTLITIFSLLSYCKIKKEFRNSV